MAIRNILNYKSPTLRQSSEKVQIFDDEIKNIINDLADTLYSTTGVGLSAIQIGINKQIFIMDANHDEGHQRNYKIFINPNIIKTNNTIFSTEGCKSAVDLFLQLERYNEITLEYCDEKGNRFTQEFKDLEAHIIQHEIDHLNGRLIMDHRSVGNNTKNSLSLFLDNTYRIINKLEIFKDLPDGTIYETPSRDYIIHIIKRNNQIQMYFSKNGLWSGIMSRIDIDHPLRLLGTYTQAAMLTLLFSSTPKNIYVIGFGGGRIPMIFHHYFNDLIIESTEIDKNVIEISKNYFGIETDERMIVFELDGRDYLQSVSKKFDIIIVDTFTGSGLHPFPFSTQEFYNLCKDHLSNYGVVCTNIVESDPLYNEKVNTFINSFNYVYEFYYDGTHVFYGTTDNIVTKDDIIHKGKEIDTKYNFRFPFEWLSTKVIKHVNTKNHLISKILTDEMNTKRQENIFVNINRNDLCPCGSGKKFKRCHQLLS